MNCLLTFCFLEQPSVGKLLTATSEERRASQQFEHFKNLVQAQSRNDTLVVPHVQIARFQDGIKTHMRIRFMSRMQSIGYEMRQPRRE
jgi:hypothetical protein